MEGVAERELPRALARAQGKDGVLSFRIVPEGFEHAGVLTTEPRGASDSVATALYRDGLRRIDLANGADEVEIGAVIDVAACALIFDGIGDDAEARAQKHEREGRILHLRFTFDRSETADRSIESELDAIVEQLVPRREDVGREDVAERWLGPKNLEPPAYAEELVSELEVESDERVEVAVAERALGILATKELDLAARTGRALEALLDGQLSGRESPGSRPSDKTSRAQDLQRAGSLLRRARASSTLRSQALESDASQPSGEPRSDPGERTTAWLQSLATEARLGAIARAIPAELSEFQVEETLELFGLFGEEGRRNLLTVLPSIQNTELRKRLGATVLNGMAPVERISQLVADRRTAVADAAIGLLGSIPGPEAEAALIGVARHGSARVRRSALRAAERMPPSKKILVGEAMLDDSDPELRVGAVQLVSAVGGSLAIEILAGEAAFERLIDAPSSVQRAVLSGLSVAGGTRALPVLLDHVEEGTHEPGDARKQELARAAIAALAQVGTDESRAALAEIALTGGPLADAAKEAERA